MKNFLFRLRQNKFKPSMASVIENSRPVVHFPMDKLDNSAIKETQSRELTAEEEGSVLLLLDNLRAMPDPNKVNASEFEEMRFLLPDSLHEALLLLLHETQKHNQETDLFTSLYAALITAIRVNIKDLPIESRSKINPLLSQAKKEMANAAKETKTP